MARLCWVATLIGVFALIVVSSVMNGFNSSIRQKLLGVEPHVSIISHEKNQQMIEQSVADNFESKVTEVNRYAKQDVIIRTLEGRFSGAISKGLDTHGLYNFLNHVHKLKFKSSEVQPLTDVESALGENEIIIGFDLARDLDIYEGDEVILISPDSLVAAQGEIPKIERMRVKSLFRTEFSDLDAKMILFKLPEVPLRFQSASAAEYGVEVRLVDSDNFRDIEHFFEDQKNFPQIERVESWAERNQALFFALKLEKAAMTSFLALSILITCFSLITVLVMLISQKRKEIGLLMALGLSRKNTERLFLAIGVCLSSVGLFCGLLMGVLASLLIHKFPLEIMPDIYYDASIPSELNLSFVFWVAIFCLIIALAAAYWPVRLYMLKSPAENLRPFARDI